MQKTDDEIKQGIIEDPRPVSAMIDDIMHNVNSFDHQAYFDSGHVDHSNSVKKMEFLQQCREGGVKSYEMERGATVVTKLTPNKAQSEDF